MKKLPTLERLRELIDYNPSTGEMVWAKARTGCRLGGKVGNYSKGYIRVRLDDVSYLAHRLAFYLYTGVEPTHQIDHINSDRSDNRAVNLREATTHQNAYNRRLSPLSTSGVKGVYQHKKSGKWVVQVWAEGKWLYGGFHDSLEDASSAANALRLKHHGGYARSS